MGSIPGLEPCRCVCVCGLAMNQGAPGPFAEPSAREGNERASDGWLEIGEQSVKARQKTEQQNIMICICLMTAWPRGSVINEQQSGSNYISSQHGSFIIEVIKFQF